MRIKKGFLPFILGLCLSLALPLQAGAAVGVSSSELQEAMAVFLPSGESFSALDGYSHFDLVEKNAISGGVLGRYEARLQSNPWHDGKLPELQVLIYAYGSQDSAHSAFGELNLLSDWRKEILASDDRTRFFTTRDGGTDVDAFGTVNAEAGSYHLVHVNGNLLYQVSLFREDGNYFNEENLETYTEAVDDALAAELLWEVLDPVVLSMSVLFPPASVDLSAKSEKSSLDLTELYEVPLNGQLSFELYVGDTEGAVGTIMDASGISEAVAGDMFLYLHSDGRLFAGIYAPEFDADCVQQSGWYRLETSEAVEPYEWNSVELDWGVNGFAMELNGERLSCQVAQARSERPLYFGDYPEDSIDQSMVGYLGEVDFEAHRTSTGAAWDDVFGDGLFLDVSSSDPDIDAFQYLQEQGIFVGSEGMLYPDNYLNRAEMMKVLTKAFELSTRDNASSVFVDVPHGVWYLPYLEAAVNAGMVKAVEDGYFYPSDIVNKAEFFTMLYRASGSGKMSFSGSFNDVTPADWFFTGAVYALQHGLVTEDFSPSAKVSRRDAARALYSLLQ